MSKVANSLIPSLLSLFNDYNDNLKNRLKADHYFLSFDEKSKKTLNKFINLSNDRFKLMKFGGKLNNVILKQRQNYSIINRDIQNDILFSTNYSTIERNKLKRSINSFKSKEILNIRDKLLETLRQRTSLDKKIRKKQDTLWKEKTHEQLIKKNSLISNREQLNSEEKNEIELIENNTKNTIKNDHENFIRGMELYKNLLKNKKNILKEKESNSTNDNNKYVKISRNDFKNIENILDENNIKILSYKEEDLVKKENEEKKDELFDINSLYRLKNNLSTKIYINKYNIKKKKYKNFYPKIKVSSKEKQKFSKNPTYYNTIETDKLSPDNLINDKRYQTFNNYDMKNTIKLVRKAAFKGVMLNEDFQYKNKKFETYYDRYFPKYDYETIERYIKLKSYKRLKKNEEEKDSPKRFIFKRKSSVNEKIMQDFLKIYNEKLKIWEKEDREKEIINKKEGIKKEDDINFLLNLVKRKKRKNIKK